MSAQQFLRILQRRERLLDWFLAFVPPNGSGGGSDLDHPPQWLEAQFSQAGLPGKGSLSVRMRQLLEQHDWAFAEFKVLHHALPDDIQRKLQPGDDFAVGTLHSAEFNGAALAVPDEFGSGHVIVLPFGVQMLIWSVSVLATIHLSEQFCRTLAAGGLAVIEYIEDDREKALRNFNYRVVRPKLQMVFTPTRLSVRNSMGAFSGYLHCLWVPS